MGAIIIANGLGEIGMPPAVRALKEGLPLLDVIEAGIMPVEADPNVPHVGIGGAPNMLGVLEADAAVMDGDTLRVGTVGALKGFASAFYVARQIFETLPHDMLVGEGAARFAAERGAKRHTELPQNVKADYDQWLKKRVPADVLAKWPNVPLAEYAWPKPDKKEEKDTVVYLARNKAGSIVGGTSTSGWGYKYPGRIGDSPIIGAGLYVDSEYGACTCTHTGEMTIRAGTARATVAYMKAGASVKDACHEAVRDLRRLKGGYLGPVTIHAIDRQGEPYAVATVADNIIYWVWSEQTDKIQSIKAVVDEVRF